MAVRLILIHDPKPQLFIQGGTTPSALGHDHDHANLSSSSDDAFFPTTGDEIKKKLFPLVPGAYYMPYPYVEGSSGEPPRVCLHYKDELSVIISTGRSGGDYTSSGPHAYINRLLLN
ncbi:hypothetical protein Tco_0287614 [Tanacetum coccineum]